MHIERKAALLITFLSMVLPSTAQNPGQSMSPDWDVHRVVLHFRFNSNVVDSSYRRNDDELARLQFGLQSSSPIEKVSIWGYSSPNSPFENSSELAQQRALSMKDSLVQQYPWLDPNLIAIHWGVARWEKMADEVERDEKIRSKSEVVNILKDTTLSEHKKDLRLQQVGGGIPYDYLIAHYAGNWRRSEIQITTSGGTLVEMPPHEPLLCTDWMDQGEALAQKEDEKLIPLPHSKEIGEGAQGCFSGVPAAADLTMNEAPVEVPAEIPTGPWASGGDAQRVRKPLLAMKSNLLYDLATIVNLGAEVPIGKHWSINAEYLFPWWNNSNNQFAMQLSSAGIEGRYWFGRNREHRRALTGHFVGLYGDGGLYDFQFNKKEGYRGDFYIAAGVSYGYGLAFNANLGMEFSLGLGYLTSNYQKYEVVQNGTILAYRHDGQYDWIGPTKIKVALVWLLNHKTR